MDKTESTIDMFYKGETDCYADVCENAPFGSVGGITKRKHPKRPDYIDEKDWPDYWAGYKNMVQRVYGPDWEDYSFGWQAAITLD